MLSSELGRHCRLLLCRGVRVFPAALSSTPATMEAQAQGGWSPVAPEVWSPDAQRETLFLPCLTLLRDGQGHPCADGTARLRAPSGSRLHPLPNSAFAVGLGTRERLGTRKQSSGSAGIGSLSALSLPAVTGPHFLVLECAQRTCCAGSGSLLRSPRGGGGRAGSSGLRPWGSGPAVRKCRRRWFCGKSAPAIRGLQRGRIGLQRQESFTSPAPDFQIDNPALVFPCSGMSRSPTPPLLTPQLHPALALIEGWLPALRSQCSGCPLEESGEL